MRGRQQLIKDLAKFTSQTARNHLLSFGEFAAMYLIAWNVENWPENYTTEFNQVDSQTDKKRVHLEIEQLEKARRGMPAIRRVLANVPTYMICDDHEITDDWNITREWLEQVRTSACGRQIIANGLAAYWAFQAWGNNPHLFDQNFVDVVSGSRAKLVMLHPVTAMLSKTIFGTSMAGHLMFQPIHRLYFWIAGHRDNLIALRARHG